MWKTTYSVCGRSSAWNVKNLTPASLRGIDMSDTARGRKRKLLDPVKNPPRHPSMK